MEKIKENIVSNLILLRKTNKLTQQEFADKINYSNKAISRWENGDSMPDIETLCEICDFYHVSFQWLTEKHNSVQKKGVEIGNKVAIVVLLGLFVWTLATIIFVYGMIESNVVFWQVFLWSAPITFIFILPFCFKWWGKKIALIIFSLFLWSILTSFFIQFLSYNIWPLFLLGIPMQAIAILLTFSNGRSK